jgi:hypothetical protein
MNTKLIITVTSAEGQPTLVLPGSLSTDEVRRVVRDRFGLQNVGNSPALPHNFCGAIVPPPAPNPGPATISMLTYRGHLRVV